MDSKINNDAHTDSGPAWTGGFTNLRGTKEGSAVVDIGMGLRKGGEIGRWEGRVRGQYCNIHTGTGPRRANADAIGVGAAKRTVH
jgi:hypothetical protein